MLPHGRQGCHIAVVTPSGRIFPVYKNDMPVRWYFGFGWETPTWVNWTCWKMVRLMKRHLSGALCRMATLCHLDSFSCKLSDYSTGLVMVTAGAWGEYIITTTPLPDKTEKQLTSLRNVNLHMLLTQELSLLLPVECTMCISTTGTQTCSNLGTVLRA